MKTIEPKILPTLNELREKGESDPEASLIFQALGAASVCWERMEGTGLFDSDRAKRIGDELLFELHGTPVKVMAVEEVERLGMAAIMEVAKHLANDATAGIANGCIAKVFMDAGIILKP